MVLCSSVITVVRRRLIVRAVSFLRFTHNRGQTRGIRFF